MCWYLRTLAHTYPLFLLSSFITFSHARHFKWNKHQQAYALMHTHKHTLSLLLPLYSLLLHVLTDKTLQVKQTRVDLTLATRKLQDSSQHNIAVNALVVKLEDTLSKVLSTVLLARAKTVEFMETVGICTHVCIYIRKL